MPTRAEMIGLLSGVLQAQVGNDATALVPLEQARLILDHLAPTSFPHVVEKDGAPIRQREEKSTTNLTEAERAAQDAEWAAAVQDEDSQWQQCATKMTRFGLRLVGQNGELIHGSTLQQVLPAPNSHGLLGQGPSEPTQPEPCALRLIPQGA